MAAGDRKLLTGRYYNCNGHAMAIVAVVTEDIDWTVYANGVDAALNDQDAAVWVALYGVKLPEADGRYFFPDIELPYRR